MAPSVIGNPLTTALARKDSPSKSRKASGNSATYRFTQKQGTAVTTAIGSADPADATIVLLDINFLPTPGGGYETVELVYGPPTPSTGYTPPAGTVTLETDANAIEIPIQQHPRYSAGSSSTDKLTGDLIPNVGGKDFPGVTSYLVPQPTVTRTEILSSFTFSEANIISGVGTRQAPTGVTSPTTNAWLKMRLSIRKNGNVIEKSEAWQYASGLWAPEIYP